MILGDFNISIPIPNLHQWLIIACVGVLVMGCVIFLVVRKTK